MLILKQHVLDQANNNYADSEVVIDLRDYDLGLAVIAPVELCKDSARMGYSADGRVKIHRRRVFDAIERGQG